MKRANINRREFLKSAALAAAALPAMLEARKKRLPIGFSTLGCPQWDWIKILDFAERYDFAAIELRFLQGSMDLPARPEFSPARLAQSKKELAQRGLRISCVDSSVNLHESDSQKHDQQLADGRRFIDLASAVGAPFVRVFGNKMAEPRQEVIDRVAAGLRELAEYGGPRGVSVLIESHGDFVDSATLREVLEKANSSHAALLWDAHHTYAAGKEDPAYTISELGKYIRHTHLKDSRLEGQERHYVLTGHGDVPVEKQVQLLAKSGYTGYYSFEWEKAWHPDLEEPEVAFAEFADVMKHYLAPGKAKVGWGWDLTAGYAQPDRVAETHD